MPYFFQEAIPNEHLISFIFETQSCDVHVSVKDEKTLHIESLTDGYRWLQFFLCQDPEAKELSFMDFKSEIQSVELLFSQIGIKYEQEDKETAFLYLSKPYNESVLIQIAELIEPRFALRERYYE